MGAGEKGSGELLEDRPIQRLEFVNSLLGRKVIDDPLSRSFAKTEAKSWIFDQAIESIRESSDVPRWHHESNFPIDHQLPVAATVGHDNRPFESHRLANGARDPGPGPRGIDHDVARREDVGHVLPVGQNRNQILDANRGCLSMDFVALVFGIAADQNKMCLRDSSCEVGEGNDQVRV